MSEFIKRKDKRFVIANRHIDYEERSRPMNRPICVVGELDICDICECSPHIGGCPRHPDYDNECISYVRADAPEEMGPARYWVEDTFAIAATDAGAEHATALREGISEFRLALKRGELRRF